MSEKVKRKTAINPDTIEPEIWEHYRDGALVEILLVCARRFAHSRPSVTPAADCAKKITSLSGVSEIDNTAASEHDMIVLPVAIGLRRFLNGAWVQTQDACHVVNPLRIITPLVLDDGATVRFSVAKHQISRRGAQVAMAYAFRTVSPDTRFDPWTMEMMIDNSRDTTKARGIIEAKNNSFSWKVTACLLNDRWNQSGFNADQKLHSLKVLGFGKVTRKALTNFLEKYGF
jgi:hypothetical protein